MKRRLFIGSLVLLPMLRNFTPAIRSAGSWESDEYAVTVTWGSEWNLIGQSQWEAHHRVKLELVSDPDVTIEYVAWTFNNINPFNILNDFLRRFRSGHSELVVLQEWSRGGASPLPMIVELNPSATDPRKEFLMPIALKGGRSMVEVMSYPRSYVPNNLEQSYRDISLTMDYATLDTSAQGPSQVGGASEPTAVPTTVTLSCPQFQIWVQSAEGWLDQIEGSIDVLEEYSNLSSSPMPGIEYGALNAVEDMDDVQVEIASVRPPSAAVLLQERINRQVSSVEFAAGLIFNAVRLRPVNRVTLDSALDSLDSVSSELTAIRQEIETIALRC